MSNVFTMTIFSVLVVAGFPIYAEPSIWSSQSMSSQVMLDSDPGGYWYSAMELHEAGDSIVSPGSLDYTFEDNMLENDGAIVADFLLGPAYEYPYAAIGFYWRPYEPNEGHAPADLSSKASLCIMYASTDTFQVIMHQADEYMYSYDAQFVYLPKAEEKSLITIPFSEFEQFGWGDLYWQDLTQQTHLEFMYQGQAGDEATLQLFGIGFNNECKDSVDGFTKKETFSNIELDKGSAIAFGPFIASPGTEFIAAIEGDGDADLYVQKQLVPTDTSYDCRPYHYLSDETCTDFAGSGSEQNFYVRVKGFRASNCSLTVSYTADANAKYPPFTISTETKSIEEGEFEYMAPGLNVAPGSIFSAEMTGTGDADLYVRFNENPTISAFHCRPYSGTSNEQCVLTVPDGATMAYIGVRGYRDATYNLSIVPNSD